MAPPRRALGMGAMMPLSRLLKDSELTTPDIERLNKAYTFALRSLSLVDRNDPLTEIIGRKIIEIGANVHDPAEIAEMAIKKLRIL
jgi:hypothetical protein